MYTDDEQDPLRQQVQCFVCNESFMPIDNVGQLKCRYHPEPVTWKSRNERTGYWKCCHRPYDPNDKGCCKCDHTEKGSTINKGVYIEPLKYFVDGGGDFLFPCSESNLGGDIVMKVVDGEKKMDKEKTLVKFLRATNIRIPDDPYVYRERGWYERYKNDTLHIITE